MGTPARIVECVPNFSEGRDLGTVRTLVNVVRTVADVHVLDQHTDPDHHRSVLTLVGTSEGVAEAAYRLAQAAVERIDLRLHEGQHPRIGALDVLPFIPLRGVSMDNCVDLARTVGSRIGRDLKIPVFLYHEAACRPSRAHLTSLRRSGLQGLATRMRTDPEWKSDFGPAELHPTAGAIAVGARPVLIAFNVNLKATDVHVAKEIAGSVRASGGGLPHLKAIGIDLASRGLVQVSMNLMNHEVTSLADAFEAVSSAAQKRGIAVESSEIVGLVPRGAVVEDAVSRLRLKHFDQRQVLDARLEEIFGHLPPAS